jgi:hypothetical protein
MWRGHEEIHLGAFDALFLDLENDSQSFSKGFVGQL